VCVCVIPFTRYYWRAGILTRYFW